MPYDANGQWYSYQPAGSMNTSGLGAQAPYQGQDDGTWAAFKRGASEVYGAGADAVNWGAGKFDDLVEYIAGGGPTDVARYNDWNESQMQSNRNAQEAARRNQMWLGDQYKNQIAGNGPSVAENQMRAGQEQAMANQISMSRGGRGPLGQGNAQYNAQVNLANQSQQVNRDAATLRAQEQLGAMQNYGQLSGQMRGQDIDMFGGEASYQKAQADSFNAWANAQAVADESAKTRKGSGIAGGVAALGSVGSLVGL